MTSDQKLGGSHEPLRGFIFQGLITKCDTTGLATATANTIIGFHVNGTLFILNGMHSAYPEGIAIFAVMFADNIEHFLSPFMQGSHELRVTSNK
jgi:hypothetical protein